MNAHYSPVFVLKYKKISRKNKKYGALIKEKIALFLLNKTDSSLRLHKLQGQLKDAWSISINRSIRVLIYVNENEMTFVDIGTHNEVYKK